MKNKKITIITILLVILFIVVGFEVNKVEAKTAYFSTDINGIDESKYPGYKKKIQELQKIYPKKYSEYVEKYAQEFNVDPLLIFSMIKAESNFKEKAKSSSGAKGLMQLMEATANEIADKIDEPLVEEESLLEPEKNIMIGTKYYSELLKNFDGNMLLAITAYNAGMGNVNQWIRDGIIKADGSDIENIPYKETNMYVRKIINNYRMYQTIYVEK